MLVVNNLVRPTRAWELTYTTHALPMLTDNAATIVTISSPEPAILLDCARNRDLWARLKAHQKNGQISLAVETCSFQPQSPTHTQNQTGTRISWFRFWIQPEPMRFPTAGQGDAGSGDEIAIVINN